MTSASEARVQSEVRLEAARLGIYLWRNQNGAFVPPDRSQPVCKCCGQHPPSRRQVRFGLANESAQINAVLKSSDLVGFRGHLVTFADVGRTLPVFMSRECKPKGWVFSGTEHEIAQQRWLDLINHNGGDAAFCSGLGSFSK